MTFRAFRLVVLVLLCAAFPLLASAGGDARHSRDGFDQFIVRFKAGSAERGNAVARQRVLAAGAQGQGLHAAFGPRLGIGADIVRLDGKLDHRAAEAFMNRLRRDPSVEYIEIDRVLKPTFTPNDPLYSPIPAQSFPGQWHYSEATGGINLPAAWDLATGSGVVVAVIDTGVTQHADLATNLVTGYDFIRNITTANDGDGRDADPSDPGDWVAADECGTGKPAEDSSWHGTHVAGTVAALTNNAKGVAGVAYNARVMPLRVLGKCGGLSSDIADAIYWAAGGSVSGVPANANPAEVINLSLGGEGVCSSSTQAAINYAIAQKTVVVVSAGNDNLDAAAYEPANCANVIAVAATQRQGARASYSNFGATVDVSAPGGGKDSDGVTSQYVYSTFNKGLTAPAADGYAGYQGTSMAAPHVAGTAALMQSVTVSTPAAVEAVLKSTARALPVACPEGCGAGIINAASAVASVGSGALLVSDASVAEGDSGTRTLSFTVSLTKAVGTAVTFDIATASQTATAGSDYVAMAMAGQSIAAGSLSKSFTVTINGDATVEPDETFAVNVSNVAGIAVADAQGIGTIVNDDATLLTNGVAVSGIAESSGQSLYYAIDLPAGRTSLVVNTGSGTGDADVYVRFGALPTPLVADCESTGSTSTETCTINAPSAGRWYVLVYGYSAISGVSLTATYTPSGIPTINIGDASVSEGNSGYKVLTFTVSLSSPAPATVSFNIGTEPGTATPGVDYISANLVGMPILAGQSSATFDVTVFGDTAVEGNETFVVELSGISNANAGDTQGQGRIVNDDVAQLRVGNVSIVEGNSGQSTAVFDITLSDPMPNPVTFDISTGNGSALAGSDYVGRSQAGKYIDAGRTRVQFTVPILGDATAEANETFSVNLSNAVGAVLTDGWSATGTILNDDGALAAPAASGPVSAQSVGFVSPVLLGIDGKPVDEAACRPAGQRRGRREPILPTCKAKAAVRAGASR